MIFNMFDQEKKAVQIGTETPYICQKNIMEKNKKCENFYKNICIDRKERGVFICPYGLCAYKTSNAIYTSLNIVGQTDLTKLVPNLKRYRQDPKQFTQYSLSQIVKIVEETEKIEYETQIRRMTIHDIKNAIKHFIDLVEDVKRDEDVKKIAKSNDKIFSSVEGYSLIQYRLAYHDKLLNSRDNIAEEGYINFHKAIKKLSKMLMYRGIKKGVEIDFQGYWRRSFLANNDLYIMYFILIENALKFALENTRVIIGFSYTEEHELKVTITNECYHIEIEDLDKIFEPGYRCKSVVNTSVGSGLGLAVAKKIADASNVKIDCRYNKHNSEDEKRTRTGKFIMECVHMKKQEL